MKAKLKKSNFILNRSGTEKQWWVLKAQATLTGLFLPAFGNSPNSREPLDHVFRSCSGPWTLDISAYTDLSSVLRGLDTYNYFSYRKHFEPRAKATAEGPNSNRKKSHFESHMQKPNELGLGQFQYHILDTKFVYKSLLRYLLFRNIKYQQSFYVCIGRFLLTGSIASSEKLNH